MFLKFAWRYFRAKKSANAINIIAWVTTCVIAFATCCQVLVLSVYNGFEDLVKSMYSSFYTDLKILPASGKTFLLTPQQQNAINALPGIAAMSMIAEDKAILQNGTQQTFVNAKGVDNNYYKVSGLPFKVVNGNFNVGILSNPGIVVGVGVQNAADISMNTAFDKELITLTLPKKNVESSDPLASLSEGNVVANGVFAIQQDFDNNYAITNIDFLKRQMNFAPEEFSAAEIKIKPTVKPTEAQRQVEDLLGENFQVQTLYQQNSNLYNTIRLEKWAIYAVLTLILIVAAFNMVSALSMLVIEKEKDISILQSMGSPRSMIRKIFLAEGMLLGFVGAVIGIALATIICLIQLKFHLIKMGGGSFLIDYFPVKLLVSDFLLVSATIFCISLLASWVPAYKASKQMIVLK